MPEILDITDTFNNITGTANRDIAHQTGLWHRTVNFILIDSKNHKIVFQNKKNKSIDDDFFVQINGGHLQAGESVEDGFRELSEETGLIIENSSFLFAGVVPTAVNFGDNFKLREFMYYYLIDVPDLEKALMDSQTYEESQAFVSIDYRDCYKLVVEESVQDISCYKIQPKKITKDDNLRANHFKNFTDDNLYKRIFSYVKRYNQGETNMPL